MALYLLPNGPMQTTAMFAGVTTGTAIKTMLQVKPFNLARVVEWGFSIDGAGSNTGLQVELIETGTVNATVTASVDNDVTKFGPNIADQAVASIAGLTLATSGTGYTGSAEGTVTAVRNLAQPQYVLGTSAMSFSEKFPLGREPVIAIAGIGRIRVLAAGAAVNMKCYMILEI